MEQVETIRVSDEMNVDIAPDGTVYGIELLNANAQLTAEDNGNLIVVTGTERPREAAHLVVRENRARYGQKKKR